MNVRKRRDLPAPLEGVRRRFEQWRRTHAKAAPARNSQSALDCGGEDGRHVRFASHCGRRFRSSTTRSRNGWAQSASAQARHEASPGTAFLELPPPLPIAACDCTLELEDTAGSKMRVFILKAASPPRPDGTLPELLESCAMIQITPQMRGFWWPLNRRTFAAASTAWPASAKRCCGTIRSTAGCSCSATGRPRALKILVYDGQGFWLCHKLKLVQRQVPLVAALPCATTRTLAAHELQVLLAAGNPEAAQAASPGDQSAPAVDADACPEDLALAAGTKTCRIDLFDFCGFGYGVSIRIERRQEKPPHSSLGRGGFCRALWNAIMVLANPIIIELDMGKLEDLLQRIDTQDLCAEDYATIHSVIESYVGLFYAVGNKNTTIARLRKILFGAKTEKTAMVVGQHPPEGIQEAARAALPGGDAPAGEDALKRGSATDGSPEAGNDSQAATTTASPRCPPEPGPAPKRHPGHGRNGADAYTAAEKIEVPHSSLQPGDPCPKCETGTVYDSKRPGVVVRLVGQSPLGATVYDLQQLRFNLCGAVSTPDLPPGAGEENCDASVGSLIALLRYGDGDALESQ